MTKEEVNREVAEKVNGWHMVYEDHLGEAWWSDNLGLKMSIADWNPAERIDHAWMVLENIVKKLHYEIELTINKSGVCCDLCRLENEHINVYHRTGADTAPAAICLAALEAVK